MNNVPSTDVILHVFDWPYLKVAKAANQIQAAGYRSVLVSPPMKSLYNEKGTKWWQRYQPQDYRLIDNQLGNTLDFKQMVDALKKCGIRIYIDVVFNHMANESFERADLCYPATTVLEEYRANAEHYDALRLYGDLTQPLFTEQDFVEAFGIEDWQDQWQVQNGRITGSPQDPGLPTLKDNLHVIKQQQEYIRAMKKLGVSGFRVDAAKHMSLAHLDKVWTEELCEGVHIFGEIITNGGATKPEYDLFLEPFLANTRLGAYDFPLFQTMFDVLMKKGSMKSLINPYSFGMALDNSRAITFAITHDIPNNDVFKNLVMNENLEWLAYSYVLGRDGGVPLIYTDLDTSGIKIKDRKPRWLDSWRHPKMLGMIKFHNLMHGEAMKVLEANDDLLVFARGEQGVVILNKSRRKQTINLSIEGTFNDLLSEQSFDSVDGNLEFIAESQSCMMLVQTH